MGGKGAGRDGTREEDRGAVREVVSWTGCSLRKLLFIALPLPRAPVAFAST